MEKPKAPSPRKGVSCCTFSCHLCSSDESECLVIHDSDSPYSVAAVTEVSDAEMLIFALQEWIEYKRQLELWSREHVL